MNKLSSSYSGGMKRRLSVAVGALLSILAFDHSREDLTPNPHLHLALVGNPKIVFLDEPVPAFPSVSPSILQLKWISIHQTTGMDPVSRREVWDIIERAKKGRVVILTTHSMEEADTLSDTIGAHFCSIMIVK